MKSEGERPRLGKNFRLLILVTYTYHFHRPIFWSEMSLQVLVENGVTFYIFGGLWFGSRGLDSKYQIQEEIMYNLFEVLVLVQIPTNTTHLWVKEILFEHSLQWCFSTLGLPIPFYLCCLLHIEIALLCDLLSFQALIFKDPRMRLQMRRIELILKLQRGKKNPSGFIVTLKARFKTLEHI